MVEKVVDINIEAIAGIYDAWRLGRCPYDFKLRVLIILSRIIPVSWNLSSFIILATRTARSPGVIGGKTTPVLAVPCKSERVWSMILSTSRACPEAAFSVATVPLSVSVTKLTICSIGSPNTASCDGIDGS